MNDKYRRAYKWLNYAFYVYVVCLVVPFTGINMTGEQAIIWFVSFVISWFTFLFSLGTLVNGANQNFLNWVGGAALFGPIGVSVSYFRIKKIAIVRGWG